jgi:ribose/xylose/arabinose/galactoside ABC-type transport system permease subunit
MKVETVNSERVKILLAQNGIFVALVVLIGVFTFLRPNFLSFANGQSILLQASELGLIAIPVAFLIMSGTIDLSVGSIASAAAVSAGIVMSETQSVTLGLLAGLATGMVAGGLNGFLVSYLGLNSFVVTLGALSVWGGYALLVSGGTTIPRSELPGAFRSLGTLRLGPVPIQIVLLVLVVLCGWYVMNHTGFGKQVKAIGGNERAAQLMGVDVKRTRAALFVASGFFSAVAGLLLSAKVQSANPNIGSGLELEALTVVLLGGVAFQGGVGRISGVVAGLLFFRVLRTGLVFMQASPFLQTILVGATLILAVALDNSVQSVVRSSWAKLGRQALEEEESHASTGSSSDEDHSSEVGQQR